MEKLCVYLPPLAPDYSGACAALYELGGLSVIHDASGCTGNYTGFDEPRWYDTQKFVFCSGLREIDAIMGNDQKLIKNVVDAAKDLNPKFIALMGSPVPMVIGTDLKGIAKEIEFETDLVSMGFNTTGLNYYDDGISKVYIELAKRFLEKKDKCIEKSVNLLGVTPLDFGNNQNVKELIAYFNQIGYKVISTWTMESDFNQILNTTKAEKNIVLSSSGLDLAKYLKRKYNMPYYVGLPLGKTGKENVEIALREHSNSLKEKPICEKEDSVLIIGEQIFSNALRELLKKEYGYKNITVASYFKMSKTYGKPQDIQLKSEIQLIELLRKKQYQFIIGDPLFENLIEENTDIKFLKIPHVAVSSTLYEKEWLNTTDESIYKLIERMK
jgi:nitrogenase molybdenum-iron protein alpha/beta subunit